MRITIKELKKSDLPAFYALFKKAIFHDFKEYSPEMAKFQWKEHRRSKVLKALREKSEIFFVAKNKEGELVAVLTTYPVFGGVACCNWLIVNEKFRGQGIGGKMLKFWERWAKKNRAHMLDLTCDRSKLGYYKKFGFVKYGYMKEGYCNENNYLMCKKIGPWDPRNLE